MTVAIDSDAAAVGRRRLVVVDDHPLLAAGLKAQLEQAGMVVDIVDPVERIDLVHAIVGLGADLILVDLEMPCPDGGVGLTGDLVKAGQTVAVLTGSTDRGRWALCLERGAVAVLTKSQSLADLVDDVATLAAGGRIRPHHHLALLSEFRERRAEQRAMLHGFDQLSEREGQVLAGLMAGLAPAAVAERDFVSVETVRSQVKNVLAKLGVNSQLAAVARAHRSGWTAGDRPAQSTGKRPKSSG